jgi:hypothetical protein
MTKDDRAGSGKRDPIDVWDDILDLIAETDAEDGEATDADLAWSASLDITVKSRLAEMRRRLTPGEVPIQRGVTIPPEVEAMDRRALVEQLEILRRAGAARYAHQELKGLSDLELRNMLALLMRSSRR